MKDILLKFRNEIRINSKVGEFEELLNVIEKTIDNLHLQKPTHPLYESPQKERNEDKYGTLGSNQCICCMKPMKEGETLMVHMNTDWLAVRNDISEQDTVSLTGADSQGSFEIGNSCAKKMLKEFIHNNIIK